MMNPHSSITSLNHVTTWVFDLDNTLYPASHSLFPQIDRRMRSFIADRLGLADDEAHALQKRYFRDFGTTLRGLMLVDKLEPADFLAYVHDIDHSALDPAPRLDAALSRLEGRKLIYTNGTEHHAEAVLDRLGIAGRFQGIFDIVAADYIPKPQPEPYLALTSRFSIDPREAVMVEDLHRNLRPAAAIGMTTVWVRQGGHPDAKILAGDSRSDETDLGHVHHITDNLTDWLESIFENQA